MVTPRHETSCQKTCERTTTRLDGSMYRTFPRRERQLHKEAIVYRFRKQNVLRLASAVTFLSLGVSAAAAADEAESMPATGAPESAPATLPVTPDATAAVEPEVVAPDAAASAVVEKAEEAPAVAGYKKGFFLRSRDGKFALTINGRLQARLAYEVVSGDDDEIAFSVPRARLTLKGHAFVDTLTYKFQADFGKGLVSLKDFYLDYRIVKSWLHLRAGQWKRPFARHHIVSSGKLALVDRAFTDKAFGNDRDIGVAVHNNYSKSPKFEYVVGIFNGTGIKPRLSGDVEVDLMTGEGFITGGGLGNVPDRFYPALVGRFGINLGGIKGYSEGDLEGGGPRFALGGAILAALDVDGDGDSTLRGTIDLMFKAYGFFAAGGVYITAADFTAISYDAFGAHLDLGYTIADRIMPVVRYAVLAPDADDTLHEIAGGANLFFFGHGMKLTVDFAALLTDDGSIAVDYRLRGQVQLSF